MLWHSTRTTLLCTYTNEFIWNETYTAKNNYNLTSTHCNDWTCHVTRRMISQTQHSETRRQRLQTEHARPRLSPLYPSSDPHRYANINVFSYTTGNRIRFTTATRQLSEKAESIIIQHRVPSKNSTLWSQSVGTLHFVISLNKPQTWPQRTFSLGW